MILHTIQASPGSAAFADCLRVLAPNDTVLLLGDGVYAAITGSEALASLRDCQVAVHVLTQDVAAAGIGELLADDVAQAGYADFVALTEVCARQLAWY